MSKSIWAGGSPPRHAIWANKKYQNQFGHPPSPKYQNEKVFFSGMGSLNQSLHVVLTNRTILSLPCLLTQHCDFHRICQKEMLAANIEDADLSNASEGKLWALDQIQGSEISLNAFFLHFEARLVWLFISLLTMLIVLSAIYINAYWISWIFFNQLRFSLGTFVSEKKNREYSNCINWLGEIKSSGGRISRDFLQIFAISRFDLAKLQNSAWFVKKFWT